MRYSSVLVLTVALFVALAIGLLAYPAGFAALFGLEPSTGAEVMARRAGVIFAALAPFPVCLTAACNAPSRSRGL